MQTQTQPGPPDRSLLAPDLHEGFRKDCNELSDVELADKYHLRERTATNWRIRLFGKRQKKKSGAPTTAPRPDAASTAGDAKSDITQGGKK